MDYCVNNWFKLFFGLENSSLKGYTYIYIYMYKLVVNKLIKKQL